MDFDLFETEGGETRHLVVLSVQSEAGRTMAFQTEGAPRYTLVVCARSAESPNPCGEAGPVPDRWGTMPADGAPAREAE